MEFPIKCRKCRTRLLCVQPKDILNAHNEEACLEGNVNESNCLTVQERNEIFLLEDNLPEWISKEVETSQWTKGKLKCSGCDSRVGSFDFISGTRCHCSKGVLPSVHLVRSKVDLPLNLNKT